MARVQREVYEDVEVYPIEASAKGTNAFFHRCSVLDQDTPYAACLDKIAQRKEGRLSTAYAACSAAINKGSSACPAVAMRKKEVEVGQAIYFLNRKKMNEFYTGGDMPSTPTTPVTRSKGFGKPAQGNKIPASIPVPPPAPTQDNNGYADAINQAIQEGKKKIAEKFSFPEPLTTKLETRGMTMLQIARLRMAQKVTQ